jgi:hypothetical protein
VLLVELDVAQVRGADALRGASLVRASRAAYTSSATVSTISRKMSSLESKYV